MKLLRLDLLAFGPFTDVSLPLDDGQHGLHIIFGPNEAGKSSALRALTQLLYGIPHNSGDNFIHAHQNLRIGAVLQNEHGEVLHCIRRKGRTGTLRADDDVDVVDPSRLVEMLGGVDESTFCERYGIDYDELRRGGEAIVAGRGGLGQILFAAGSGAADLGPLQTRLTEGAEALFKPRGSNQRINKGIAELAAAHKELKQAQLPSSEWVKHDKALSDAQDRKQRIDEQLVEQIAEKNRLQRILEAIPLIAQRRRAVDGFEQVAASPLLPADFAEQRREASVLLASATNNAKAASEAIAEIDAAVAKLSVPEALLEHRTTITALHSDLGSFRKAAKDRPGLVQRRERAEQEARTILLDLGRPDDLGEADNLRLSKTQRLELQTLSAECKAVQAKRQAAEQQVFRLKDEIGRAQAKLDGLPEQVDGSQLRAALRRAQQQGDLDERLAEARAEVSRIEQQAKVDLHKLPLWTGSLDDLEQLPVPASETIQRHDDQLAEATREIQAVEQRIDEMRDDAQAIDQQLERLRLERDLPTEDELSAARRIREQGWQLVRQDLRTGGADESQLQEFIKLQAPATDLAAAYEASVREADQIADRLRIEADRVATKAKLTSDRQELDRRGGELQEQLAAAQRTLALHEENWRSVWQPLGVAPLSPREMKSWATAHAALVALAVSFRTQRGRSELLQDLVDSHCQSLRDTLTQLGESVDGSDGQFASLVQRCEEVISRIEANNNQRDALARELEKLQQQLPQAERDAQQSAAAWHHWQGQWGRAVARLGLDEHAEPAAANHVLEAVDELFDHLKEADDLQRRTAGIDRDADEFTQTVGRIIPQVAPDLADRSAEQAASDLYDRLSVALRAQTKRDELNKQRTRAEATLEKARTEIRKLQAAVETMCREAGCGSADELPEAERRSARRLELQRELEKLDEQLLKLAAGVPLDQFMQEADQCDPDQLQPTIQQFCDAIAQLEEEKSQVSETIGSQRTELARMDGSGRAAEAQELSEHLAAQIRSDVEQYTRLRLASAVLRGAIERYREKNQGPVLERASSMFAQLTGGSFESLRAEYNEKGEAVLVGVRPGGKQTVGVAGLSEGTESQLYLALRLAILETDLSGREPIPFIVDDILKDFDDDRSVAALKAFARLSEKTQVILFTHHRHLVRLAEENLNDGVVFTHDLEPTGIAEEKIVS